MGEVVGTHVSVAENEVDIPSICIEVQHEKNAFGMIV